ncbi:MAG TPA: glycosyltransferase family 2 protein [Burkholderiales bacterium]|jgi:glycosyltransferase involved in cell wall biosynthesis
MKLVSLVVPFHNEAGGVEAFHREVSTALNALPAYRFEIVCVDDGSSDATLQGLLQLVERDRRVRVLELSRNFGKEAALTAGLDAARGDAVVAMDADLQDPPQLIGRLIEEWSRGADVVLARRTDRSADSFLKRTSAGLFYRIHNRLSSVQIPDNVGDFRLIDRAAVEALKALPERQRFMKGLFAWIGFRTATVDYARRPRASGATKFSGWRLWNFALEGITSFSTAPLRVWTYVGALGALLTFLYALFIIARVLILGVDVPGYASLLVAVLFFGSLQLLSVGLLGEYIGRVYLETKQRPVYVVRREFGARDAP